MISARRGAKESAPTGVDTDNYDERRDTPIALTEVGGSDSGRSRANRTLCPAGTNRQRRYPEVGLKEISPPSNDKRPCPIET